MNLLISGPCGVGKSAISKILALKLNKTYLNFDELGLCDMEKRNPEISPFSHGGFDILACMQIMLEKIKEEFILDIGGDNIFRLGADNNRYLNDLFKLKRKYSVKIFIIIADKETVCMRFWKTRSKSLKIDFEKIWEVWRDITKPYWEKCLDFLIDTTTLSETDTCQIIESKLKHDVPGNRRMLCRVNLQRK